MKFLSFRGLFFVTRMIPQNGLFYSCTLNVYLKEAMYIKSKYYIKHHIYISI